MPLIVIDGESIIPSFCYSAYMKDLNHAGQNILSHLLRVVQNLSVSCFCVSMGCVNTKLSPSRNEGWRQDYGYGSQSRAAIHTSRSYNNQRPLSDKKLQHKISTSRTAVNGGGRVREEERAERVVAGAEKHEVGNVSKRFVDKKIGKDVFVGAWPKWLVDNIPAYILAVIVPKSADCYEMLAKVTNQPTN